MAAVIYCYIITFVKLVMLLPKGPFSAVEFLFVCYTGNTLTQTDQYLSANH